MQAASAVSTPVESVHFLTLSYLRAGGHKTRGLLIKSLSEIEAFNLDKVIAVYDNFLREECPLWMRDEERMN